MILVIKIANKPADEEHPYGHESRSHCFGMVGIVLLIVSFYLVYEGITGVFHSFTTPTILAMWVAIFSFGFKEILYKYSLKKA